MRKITSPRATAPSNVTVIKYMEELFVYVGGVVAEAIVLTATGTTTAVGVPPHKRSKGMSMGNGERGSSRRVNSGAWKAKGTQVGPSYSVDGMCCVPRR